MGFFAPRISMRLIDEIDRLARGHERRPQRVSTAKVLLDVALRTEHPDAFIQHVAGTQTRFKR